MADRRREQSRAGPTPDNRGSLFEEAGFAERFRDGDPAALAQVYHRHAELVLRVARAGAVAGRGRVAGLTAVDARDFVHDVFVRAFAGPARLAYDARRPYRRYLLQIARNLLVDRARRGGREVLAEAEPTAPPLDLAARLDAARLSAAIRSFVARLDPEAHAVAQLRFEERCSQRQVAQRLGTSRRRVRTVEARIARDLRAALCAQGLCEPV